MSQEFVITTARLSLRPLRGADCDVVVDLINDYEVSRWLTVVPHPYDAADFQRFLTYLADRPARGNLVITHERQVVGMVGIGNRLGFWLGRAFHGRGYMSEAAGALVDWYFTHEAADQLLTGHFDGNAACCAVLTKLGFRPQDAETVYCVAQDTDVVMKNMCLTRADWQTHQTPAPR